MGGEPRASGEPAVRRNKGYAATHHALIEAAVRLISERGLDALSLSSLAREVGINRTTIYYHFASRDNLIDAVSEWSAAQLANGFQHDVPQPERIAGVARFVVANPDLIKLWIDQFLAKGDIRDRYPKWDELVAGLADSLGSQVDAEVYATFLLTGAILGPRVFANSVRPDLDEDAVVERFRDEQQRMLRRDGLSAENFFDRPVAKDCNRE